MQNDRRGLMLQPGDVVLLPCKVRVLRATETSSECELEVAASEGFPAQTLVGTIKGAQLLRANPGDLSNFDEVTKLLAVTA